MSASVVATDSVVRACSSSELSGRSGTKTLPLTYPTQKSGVNSGDRGGQAIVTPRPIHCATEVGSYLVLHEWNAIWLFE